MSEGFSGWNEKHRSTSAILDETLREGLQAPDAHDPEAHEKCEILSGVDSVGVEAASIGFPASSPRARQDALILLKHHREQALRVIPLAAARTLENDITIVADLVQRSGVAVEVYTFVGASGHRRAAEGWELGAVGQRIEQAGDRCRREGLRWTLVTEDTSRTEARDLEFLFDTAWEAGASRLCLCDTAGYAAPSGTRALIAWTQRWRSERAARLELDWHGHNDRGLALANALVARDMSVERVHATVLGLGERAGNTPLEQLLLNAALDGLDDGALDGLARLCHRVSSAFRLPISPSAPVSGSGVHRTSSGVHAAAITKALASGDHQLADRVYSAVPAAWLGRTQEIALGHLSGTANVRHWLNQRGLEPRPERIDGLLDAIKQERRTLSDHEIWRVLDRIDAGNDP
ncbi:MAG: 2-isopropylmalate synthase [Myxococcota bacterium]